MVDEETVRKKLKALRDYYGISTKTTAERVGMEPKRLQNYFRGERDLAADELVDFGRDLLGGLLDGVEALAHQHVAVYDVRRILFVQSQGVGDAVEGVHALVALVAPVPHLAVHPVGCDQVEDYELVNVFRPTSSTGSCMRRWTSSAWDMPSDFARFEVRS